ncbi:unnamed protein product [Caenorhabditis angaria]|uniref:Uncharacterized protein n=1 Tax=Caenorhabditis angaria TaxID=860376 RepID=A0A9P1IKS5_9PELO|nr:unnamed protein product [Caenorhabditis angaria]
MSADERLEEVCETLEDPDVELRRKISTILTIPRIFTVQELTTERCEKLFTSAPVEVFDCVLNSEDRQFQDGKPLIAHILSFCCQMTSPTTHMKFKPVIANIVKLSTPKNGPLTTSTLNDITIIVTYMSDDRKCIYDFLRNTTSYFINQGEKLEVEVFLSISKLLLSKIFSLINVGDDASTIDTRVWPVGILSIIRNLIKEKTEKMSETIIIGIWDIIGSVSRLMGPDWFSLDENFAKIVAQMNTVEINMALHTADSIDVVKFARHLRILEVFVSAINDEEIFTEGGTLNDVCLAVSFIFIQ